MRAKPTPSNGCPDGAPEVPFGDEVADAICYNIGVPRSQCPDRLEVMHRVERKHSISEAQRRKQYLAETARIENQPTAIEPLQRRNRSSRVAMLAATVIFKDHRTVFRDHSSRRRRRARLLVVPKGNWWPGVTAKPS